MGLEAFYINYIEVHFSGERKVSGESTFGVETLRIGPHGIISTPSRLARVHVFLLYIFKCRRAMASFSASNVTELLADLRKGERAVEEDLLAEVHAELRRLARGQRRRWRGDPSLRTTALAHEAYLRLVDREEQSWENRSHFFAVAATAMRQILLNEARRKRAEKRGGDAPLLSLEKLRELIGQRDPADERRADDALLSAEEAEFLVLLGEAMDRFDEEHPRAARGVECRFFGGMTIEETAEGLDVSEATVSRDWNQAKAWLYREMKNMRSEGEGT